MATYKYWLENIKDWCISRQLWWGQRIPAWYDKDGKCYVAENIEEAAHNSPFTFDDLRQDEDVLDTWFSSWLWPIETFKGITQPGNADFKYYYPTKVLVTGQDIIFFWVARMIMAGMEYMDLKPFNDVYFTGMVRDKLGRKMSKSLNNSPDLLKMIERTGADAVRFGIMISSPAGNDLLFDDTSPDQGRNFNNKIWNALKLVKMWEERIRNTPMTTQGSPQFAITWFENRLHDARADIEKLLAGFKISEALKTIYSLIWDDFCSWYLEWIKPGYEQPIDKQVYDSTVRFFEQLMQLLHPFMPFITEEVYHLLHERTDDLCVKQFDLLKPFSAEVLERGQLLKDVITGLRDARNKQQLKPKDEIKLHIQASDKKLYDSINTILAKQVNATELAFVSNAVPNTIALVIGKDKFYIESHQAADTGNQKDELLKELEYLQGFLVSVNKKLTNERFIQNAKQEIISLEQKKKEDAEAKIRVIEESLANL